MDIFKVLSMNLSAFTQGDMTEIGQRILDIRVWIISQHIQISNLYVVHLKLI